MLEKECWKLLRLDWPIHGSTEIEMTLETLTTAIVRSLESRLVWSLAEIKGFTAVKVFDDDALLLLRNGDKLMCLEPGYENEDFATLTDGATLFRYLYLDNDGLLHEVLPQPIVDEYKRLSDAVMADRIARSEENDRKRDRDELARLLKKQEAGLI